MACAGKHCNTFFYICFCLGGEMGHPYATSTADLIAVFIGVGWSRQKGSLPCPPFLYAIPLPTSALLPLIKVICLACVEIMLIFLLQKQLQLYIRKNRQECALLHSLPPSIPPPLSLILSISFQPPYHL